MKSRSRPVKLSNFRQQRHELLGGLRAVVSARATASFHGEDFCTARLIAADLGVAAAHPAPMGSADVTSRPIADSPFTRFVYSCRLDTDAYPPLSSASRPT